jgi:hypothetical protein
MEYKIISTNSNITQKYEFVNQKLYNTYKHLLAAREAILAGTIGSASAFSARVWEETPPTLLEIMPALRPEGYLDLGDRTEEGGRIASPVTSAVEFPLLYSHICIKTTIRKLRLYKFIRVQSTPFKYSHPTYQLILRHGCANPTTKRVRVLGLTLFCDVTELLYHTMICCTLLYIFFVVLNCSTLHVGKFPSNIATTFQLDHQYLSINNNR